uniref:Uncharacterized protein n=1 Tax=Siphoviridae sp. ctaDn21 TaxID=2825563 RepID=A0A8S5UV32_9CAUD|nr:MAG TPA: hypothetical protein [Siphoviridae sp. ctaDn21]
MKNRSFSCLQNHSIWCILKYKLKTKGGSL